MKLHIGLLLFAGVLATGLAVMAHSARPGAGKAGTFPPRVDWHGDDLPDGALARLGTLRLEHGTRVRSLCYSPDRRLLATGGEDHKVRVWETATGKELHVLDAGKEPHRNDHLQGFVEAVVFLPGKGKPRLLTGNNDGIVRLWDGLSGRQIAEFPQPAAVRALAASPDGKWLAVGADRGILMWNLKDGKNSLRLERLVNQAGPGDRSVTELIRCHIRLHRSARSATRLEGGLLWHRSTSHA